MRYSVILILILGFILRFYGINWDQGFHLHPDERMLIMVADRIHFWDKLNPDFFNYGSLPIYLLKGTSQLLDTVFITHFSNYDGLLYVGRFLSILFDLGTLLVVYLIAKLVFNHTTSALGAAFLYAVTFFPIQNAHFFVVDVYLTFFVTLTLYLLLRYIKEQTIILLFFLGISFAAALATKVTAIIFSPEIIVGLLSPLFFAKKTSSKKSLFSGYLAVVIFFSTTVLFYFIFMPYAYLTFQKFLSDSLLQTQMSKDPYIFPYTLQYVYTLPYLYHIKNMFFWGLGPVISLIAVYGVLEGLFKFISELKHSLGKKITLDKVKEEVWLYKLPILLVLFYVPYFLVIGASAVKFMRYMLPLYPLIAIIAGYGIFKIKNEFKFGAFFLLALAFVWSLSFIQIYSLKHTRIRATEWITSHIPAHSTIAVEHWDDRLPIYGTEDYNMVDLTIYDLPDDGTKWAKIKDVTKSSDYIIIASNRLYTPLQKLADCNKYKKCYPKTAEYYKDLFNEELGFKKVAEFRVNPKLPFLPFEFSDQSADESFTVYDHPVIFVFKKTSG